MSDDKHKKQPHTLIQRSRWYSRRLWATYLGMMVFIFGLGLGLVSTVDHMEIGVALLMIGFMLGTWSGVSTALALRDQRLYRRRLGEGIVRVPVYDQPEPERLQSVDGTWLEVVQAEDDDVILRSDQV